MKTRLAQFALLLALLISAASAQDITLAQEQAPQNPEPSDPAVTMFPHSQTSRYWISGQSNIIVQWHPSFYAKYSGPHSFGSEANDATSHVSTLFLGYALTGTTEVFLHLEEASGGGLSDGLGLAGFVNLDVVRNPVLSKDPYLARVMLRQIVPLSHETREEERNPWFLATKVPVRRLEFRFGKMGVNDFFDGNDVGTDSHSQFLNWTVDNNGAYDYAADTRGYTYGLLLGYYDRNWAFQFAEALMPKVANGIDLVWNLRRARAENFELQLHPKLFGQRNTSIRLLSFVNHANMGVYQDAVNNFLSGITSTADITAHPPQTTIKYGFGINLEQELPHHLRAYGRWGWNEGQHESYAYTEDDETVQFGGDLAGDRWHRKLDKAGVVVVSNGISAVHQKYLALGGEGFLLGDGALTYGRENIEEAYYNAHIWRGLFMGFDLQHINNPGYNRDRGPILVSGVRFHIDY